MSSSRKVPVTFGAFSMLYSNAFTLRISCSRSFCGCRLPFLVFGGMNGSNAPPSIAALNHSAGYTQQRVRLPSTTRNSCISAKRATASKRSGEIGLMRRRPS